MIQASHFCKGSSRPDLCYVVTKLSQLMSNLTNARLNIAKHALRYVKGTLHYTLNKFQKSDVPLKLIGFCDADWGASEDLPSLTGYAFQLSDNGPLISWKSQIQHTVALSTIEAECMVFAEAAQEAKFLRHLLI